jgi:2-(1,2-epoxy-1,2-dihydrophenyl)acetyl-CoA isomerase
MTTELLTEIDGPVARITFNRPESRNAANPPMLAAMLEFLQRIEHNSGIRCIVITGAGEHFMAGGDVMGFNKVLELSSAERLATFETRVLAAKPLFEQLARMPQPIVARVRGAVAGAALGFVAGADFVVCGSSAIFILSHVKIGASPDGASSFYLPRVVGVRKAKELAILGEKITAIDALALGLANSVVPDAELDVAVEALVNKIVAAPVESVRRAKLLMDQSLRNSLDQQLRLEAASFAACAATDNFIEGVSAFVQKRAAVFNKQP